MKTVLLLRHAKSSWADAGLDDFDRPLNDRGREAAPRIAAHLADAGLLPEIVVASPAQRTRETVTALVPALGGKAEIVYEDKVYLAPSKTLLKLVHGLDDRLASVLIVGHNPGLEELAKSLAGHGNDKLRKRLAGSYPTGALAALSFDVARWRDVAAGAGRLTHFARPKDMG